MRRTVWAVTLLLAVTATVTGCGFFAKSELSKMVEYHLEVTGVTAEKIEYTFPQTDDNHHTRVFTEEKDNQPLPWTTPGIASPGVITLKVTPKGGPATCRIVVEKKELVKKVGQPGTPLTCTAKVKG